ncbi:Respiratory supercomplex factor 1, mitochondrial [Coemansia erecta]|uniref:Respiratory supercomplex factor 1, mitochondrial n=1 Tax=Coemansia erecta TaxID=147472 RepID=A0A9W7Y142_9FUNG|nr:Respiratory supercomplex factor 1, mitochondrial [Coemansia erecta]
MSGSPNSIIGKIKEEPLVPLGFFATVGAFLYAAHGMHRGNNSQTQWGMRARVVMQGLTVAALLGYGLFHSTRDSTKSRKEDFRTIDWDKLEQDAIAAEKAENSSAPPQSPLDKLIAKAEAQKKKSVFAPESAEKK